MEKFDIHLAEFTIVPKSTVRKELCMEWEVAEDKIIST